MTYYTWNHQSVTFNDSAPRLWSPSVIIFLPWFYHFKLVYFVLEKTQDIIATFPASATSDLQVWYTLQPVFRDHRQTSSHIAKLRCLNVLSVLSCEIWDVFFSFRTRISSSLPKRWEWERNRWLNGMPSCLQILSRSHLSRLKNDTFCLAKKQFFDRVKRNMLPTRI